MWSQLPPEKRHLIIGLVISLLVHLSFGFFVTSPLPERLSRPNLREVQLIEEEVKKNPKKPPKLRKLIQQQKPKGPENKPLEEKKIDLENVQKPKLLEEPEIKVALNKKALIPEQEVPVEKIDLQKVTELAETQAPIDIENLEPTLPGEAVDVVLGVTGKQKSTEEILKEAPVPTINLQSGGGGLGEGSGIGLGGGGGVGDGGGVITLQDTLGLAAAAKIQVKKEKPRIPAPVEQTRVKPQAPRVEIHGDIAQRVKKRVMPVYPERARRMGWEGEVVIRLQVDPQGNVIPSSVVIVRSSGYPDLDNAAKRAALRWSFDPLPANVVQEVQSGTIVFRFVLEY